jgi:hypothetical protein
MAAAVLLAASVGASAATIDNGLSSGNGGLFFNVWDSTGSYTRNLGINLTTFEADAAANTPISAFTADSNLTSFLTGKTAVSWNIMAFDDQGAVRVLETSAPGASITAKPSTTLRSDAGYGVTFVNNINTKLSASTDSAIFATSDAGYALGTNSVPRVNGSLGFNSFGSLANNSNATGLIFIEANGAASGSATGTYPILGAPEVAYLDSNNALHIEAQVPTAPVPEPETYAMFLAGLGLMGAIARRRLNRS